jgi:hypothetical protein
LYDAKGSQIWRGAAQLRAGSNEVDLPQPGSLPKGLLLLTVIQGGHQQAVKIEHQ